MTLRRRDSQSARMREAIQHSISDCDQATARADSLTGTGNFCSAIILYIVDLARAVVRMTLGGA